MLENRIHTNDYKKIPTNTGFDKFSFFSKSSESRTERKDRKIEEDETRR